MTKNNTDPAGLSSSPRYRVIADRDRGDDPTTDNIFEGDRYTMQANPGPTFTDQVVRIERPVPTTDESVYVRSIRAFIDAERPALSLPTREQIAKETFEVDWGKDAVWESVNLGTRDGYLRYADAVLALFQRGDDRG